MKHSFHQKTFLGTNNKHNVLTNSRKLLKKINFQGGIDWVNGV